MVLAARHLWQELGLDKMLSDLPHRKAVAVEEAVFRMVVNRLVEPESKLGLCDFEDEHGNLHRGWQGKVHWPSGAGDLDYHHYLRAMDVIHPHRHALERLRELRVVEYTWDKFAVARIAKPGPELAALLKSLGIDLGNPVLSVRPPAAA